ncbi:COX assembly mitochondrial protein homolog [Bombyx mandarina]|uniref:COX assembly mitochondrial protein n=2 Tax=Bombyx TaxID=7090 RepID=B9VTR8_BOMMO|nr:Cmc1 protein [Bombyx mori]XP_028041495.1 COX assembly mitochondrial protein homolog [Bombyx mandarina]ACM24344.1 CMC1 [Bombyx mori]
MAAEKSVLPPTFSAGPKGLGDPDDRRLRKVEIDVMIPKLIREKAKQEKCIEEVAQFEKCCKDASLLMVVKCRSPNAALKDCLSNWYNNEEFKKICTEEYLKERSEYRRTGVKKAIRRA